MSDHLQAMEVATIPAERPEVHIGDARSMLMNMPVEQMIVAQQEYIERRKQFRDWIKSQMVEGLHYGFSPGCEPKINDNGEYGVWNGKTQKMMWYPPSQWVVKPSLYKAGAEFVTDLMNLLPVYTADKPAWEMLGSQPGVFVIRCQLYPKGSQHVPENLVGEGLGCRKVGQKGGDENNAVKMASKSAMVCAVLNSYGLSDLFTQDVEEGSNDKAPVDNPSARPEPKVVPRAKRDPSPVHGPGTANEQLQNLKARWKAVLVQAGDTADEDSWRQWVQANTDIPANAALSPNSWVPSQLKLAEAAILKLEGLPY